MILGNLVVQPEVVEQRFRTDMLSHHDQQTSENVTAAHRPRDLEPNLRHGLTTERLFMLGCFADILLWPLKMLWPHWAEAIGHIGAYDYRFYFGVYVRSVGRFTPVYMAPDRPVPQAGRLSGSKNRSCSNSCLIGNCLNRAQKQDRECSAEHSDLPLRCWQHLCSCWDPRK